MPQLENTDSVSNFLKLNSRQVTYRSYVMMFIILQFDNSDVYRWQTNGKRTTIVTRLLYNCIERVSSSQNIECCEHVNLLHRCQMQLTSYNFPFYICQMVFQKIKKFPQNI